MLYSEDMTGHAVIGEAAINLAVREQEITVDSLLAELNVMQRGERLCSRITRISAAIGWLRDFRTIASHDGVDPGWMLSDVNDRSAGSEVTIRLQADEEDGMPEVGHRK